MISRKSKERNVLHGSLHKSERGPCINALSLPGHPKRVQALLACLRAPGQCSRLLTAFKGLWKEQMRADWNDSVLCRLGPRIFPWTEFSSPLSRLFVKCWYTLCLLCESTASPAAWRHDQPRALQGPRRMKRQSPWIKKKLTFSKWQEQSNNQAWSFSELAPDGTRALLTEMVTAQRVRHRVRDLLAGTV